MALSPDLTGVWSAGNPFNFTDYRNAEVTRLFDQALSQPTEDAAAPLWRQAASLIARDQPYTFLYFYDQVNALNSRLRGVLIDALGHYQNPWEWWIPRAQQRGGPPPHRRTPRRRKRRTMRRFPGGARRPDPGLRL